MPVKRDADGNVIEQPTVKSRKTSASEDHPTDLVESKPVKDTSQTASSSDYDATTRLVGSVKSRTRQPQPKDEYTKVYRPGKTKSVDVKGVPAADSSEAMQDPPVGWLVIVDGPGKGNFGVLRNGLNSIGRNKTERISLDYGDQEISRANHATVTYDPKGKKFYIQQGSGTNLVYVNDQPVLTPQQLEPFTHVQIGSTILRFIPLCGRAFDWDTN